MAERVTSVQDDSLANPAGGPGQAVIEVTTRDGQLLRCHVTAAKGDPHAPLRAAEVWRKFADCLDYAGIAAARGQSLQRLLAAVDQIDDMGRLSHALGGGDLAKSKRGDAQ